MDICVVDDEYKVWSVLPGEDMTADKATFNLVDANSVLIATHDPRIRAFGWRVILPTAVNGNTDQQSF